MQQSQRCRLSTLQGGRLYTDQHEEGHWYGVFILLMLMAVIIEVSESNTLLNSMLAINGLKIVA